MVMETESVQLSVAEAVPSSARVTWQSEVPVEIVEGTSGQVMSGLTSSTTVNVLEQEAWLVARSVAVQVTVCDPGPNGPAGEALMVMETEGVQLSVAEAVPSSTRVTSQSAPVEIAEDMFGQVIKGSSLSVTVAVKLQVAYNPPASVTV